MLMTIKKYIIVWHMKSTQYFFSELINIFLLIFLIFISLAQPSLLPYKPPGSKKMYYVPQLKQIPPSLDSRSDTTIESSHSGIMHKLFRILFFEILLVDWLVNSRMTYESSTTYNPLVKHGAYHASVCGLEKCYLVRCIMYM